MSYPVPVMDTTIGGEGADFSIFEEKPEVTEPETTEPVTPPTTGDSTVIFAVIAVISILGVAVVAKKREN